MFERDQILTLRPHCMFEFDIPGINQWAGSRPLNESQPAPMVIHQTRLLLLLLLLLLLPEITPCVLPLAELQFIKIWAYLLHVLFWVVFFPRCLHESQTSARLPPSDPEVFIQLLHKHHKALEYCKQALWITAACLEVRRTCERHAHKCRWGFFFPSLGWESIMSWQSSSSSPPLHPPHPSFPGSQRGLSLTTWSPAAVKRWRLFQLCPQLSLTHPPAFQLILEYFNTFISLPIRWCHHHGKD